MMPWRRSTDRKSTRLNSSHVRISYAVFCLNRTPPTQISTLSLHDALPICPHLSSQPLRRANPGQVGKSLVDTVHLQRRHHALDDGHYSLAHVAVEGIVARERDDAVAPKYVPDLVVWLPHFHVRLGVGTARDNAAIIVAQHYDWHPA